MLLGKAQIACFLISWTKMGELFALTISGQPMLMCTVTPQKNH